MIVLPPIVMKALMMNIVEATHGLSDHLGAQAIMETIPEPQLRMAAITAIQIATGKAIWPGDQVIHVKSNEPRRVGVVQFD